MSRKKREQGLTICLGIHNHQPTGNFDFVVERAVEQCYRPLVEVIAGCPEVKWTFHFSGPLLLWLKDHDRHLIQMVRQLVEKGQVEILGSGIGEPVLSVLPPHDVRAQIDEMRALCSELLGTDFKGIWLTERVWEPALAASLSEAGVEYTFVDDHHFVYAGLDADKLGGYYTTEKYGRVLKVFPISERLRYLIPFTPLKEVFDKFEDMASEEGNGAPASLCCVDDGEKFGLWPGTREWVFEKRWLAQFVEGLRDRAELIRVALPREIVESTSSSGRVALPTTSYREITEWALPLEAAKEKAARAAENSAKNEGKPEVQRSGYWDQFLTKYEEANRLHKRMLWTSERVARLATKVGQNGSEPAKWVRKARHELHLGQCNDAFWHGLFGGLYLPFLRAGVFEKLLEADMLLDQVEQERGTKWFDFDCDGQDEWFVRTADQTLVVRPADGGCLYLWEDHDHRLNLSDVLTRREELYHRDVVSNGKHAKEEAHVENNSAEEAPCTIHAINTNKEEGLSDYLFYDRYPRYSGRVFVSKGPVTADELRRGTYSEIGNLSNARFVAEEASENGEGYHLRMRADSISAGAVAADLAKTIRVLKSGVGFDLSVALENAARFKSCHAEQLCLEFNVTLNAIDDQRSVIVGSAAPRKIGEQLAALGERRIVLRDEYRRCIYSFEISRSADIAVYPLETVSTSESGFERTLQGLSLVFTVPLAAAISGGEVTVTARRESLV